MKFLSWCSAYFGEKLDRVSLQHPVTKVSAGEEHVLLLTNVGTVFGMGRNDRIGHTGEKGYCHFPFQLPLENTVDLCCGSKHSLVLDDAGVVKGFGDNSISQIGGDTALVLLPKVIAVDGPVKLIACGSLHSLVSCKNETYGFGWVSLLSLVVADVHFSIIFREDTANSEGVKFKIRMFQNRSRL